MLKKIYICILYVVLWFFYNLQSLFGIEGSILTKILVLLLDIVSLLYVVRVHQLKTHSMYIYMLDLFLFVMTTYAIVYMFNEPIALYSNNQASNFNYLKNIYNSLLPIYFFYYYTRKKIIDESFMRKLAYGFLILALGEYILNGMKYIKILEFSSFDESFNVVNNMGYIFVSLFPSLVLFYKKPLFQYIALIYVLLFVSLSMKRGAFFIGIICLFFFLFKLLYHKSKKRLVIASLVSVLILTLFYFFIEYLIENNDYFFHRIAATLNGDSSGREYLFSKCYNYFLYETSTFQFLFGSGAMKTIEVTRVNVAHNDWLELAVNQGLLGIVIYLGYWISFFLFSKSLKNDYNIRFMVQLLIIIYLIKSLFSMSYTGMVIYSSSVLGYCLGVASIHKKKFTNGREKDNLYD